MFSKFNSKIWQLANEIWSKFYLIQKFQNHEIPPNPPHKIIKLRGAQQRRAYSPHSLRGLRIIFISHFPRSLIHHHSTIIRTKTEGKLKVLMIFCIFATLSKLKTRESSSSATIIFFFMLLKYVFAKRVLILSLKWDSELTPTLHVREVFIFLSLTECCAYEWVSWEFTI